MIPVMIKNIEYLDLNKKYNKNENNKYQKLLKNQLFWLNRNKQVLFLKSNKLYNDYINKNLNINVMKRCCDFKLLEKKCIEYNGMY